jgi:hypothetical protein
MSIHLWRRHKKCSHHRAEFDREFITCSCVIQAEGLLPGYDGYRCLSTGTRVMAEAQKMVFYAEHYGSWDKAKQAVLTGLPLGLPSESAHCFDAFKVSGIIGAAEQVGSGGSCKVPSGIGQSEGEEASSINGE